MYRKTFSDSRATQTQSVSRRCYRPVGGRKARTSGPSPDSNKVGKPQRIMANESSPVVNRQFPTGEQSVPSEGTIGLLRVPGLEHLADATYGCYQHVDFLLGVVECKRGSYRSRNAQTVHQGLGTVVTGAYGDTQSVE